MFDYLNAPALIAECGARRMAQPQRKIRDPAPALTLLAILAPWFSASNFPVAWMFWSAMIAVIWGGAPERVTGQVRTKTQNRILWLSLVFALFAFLQATQGILPGNQWFLPGASVAPSATLLAAIRICGLVLLVVVWFDRRRSIQEYDKYLSWIIWGISLQAALALSALIAEDHLSGSIGRSAPVSHFVGPNALAMQLGFGLILGLARLHAVPSGGRGLQIVCLATIAVALFATQSRLGIASAFTGCVYLTALLSKSWQRAFGHTFALGMIALVGLWTGGGWERMAQLPDAFAIRLAFYDQVWALITANWISGVGIDAFELAFMQVHRPPVTAAFVWDHTHSTYLALWAEAGIFAGSLPIIIALVAAARLRRNVRFQSKASGRAISAGTLAILLQVALHSLFDFAVEVYGNLLTLACIVAIAQAPVWTTEKGGATHAIQ